MKTVFKKFQFLSLLMGLLFGSFAFVACGDDDKNENENTTTSVSEAELIGNWYLVESNSSDKVIVDVITINANKSGTFVVLKARSQDNWKKSEPSIAFTYTYNGRHIVMTPSGSGNSATQTFEGDITKENGKYMVERYENGKSIGKAELTKVNAVQEAKKVFEDLVAARSGSGKVENSLVGLWEPSSMKIEVLGQFQEIPLTQDDIYDLGRVELKGDGTANSYEYDTEKGAWVVDNTMQWSYDGTYLITTETDYGETYVQKVPVSSITASTFTLKMEGELIEGMPEGSFVYLTYKKV